MVRKNGIKLLFLVIKLTCISSRITNKSKIESINFSKQNYENQKLDQEIAHFLLEMYDREQYVHNLNQNLQGFFFKKKKRSEKRSLADTGYLFSEMEESEWLSEWLLNYFKNSVNERLFERIMGFDDDSDSGYGQA